MVFQGTVLGPCLWNIFFSDVSATLNATTFRDTKYADDLSIYKLYANSTDNNDILNDLHTCRSLIHAWGARNGVAFDPPKEEFCVVHPHYGNGTTFKLLGPLIDPKLTMHDTIDKTLGKARPKLKALLRTKTYYSIGTLINQYKTHVLPLIETCRAVQHF